MEKQDLQNEWTVLQNQYDSYEKCGLVIKLFAIVLVVILFQVNIGLYQSVAVVFIVWIQEAIWKTFQARIDTRLLAIEQQLVNEETPICTAFQYNSEFAKNRLGILGLVKEYWKQAIRPTVAFPHALLAIIVVLS